MNESERLLALVAYGLLDPALEPELEPLVRLAATICDAPIAFVGIMERDRQFFRARIGIELGETSRDISFCAHTLPEGNFLEVPDTRLDERFVDNPLVSGAPHARFYAGAPLVTGGGQILGTLCVMDRQPRTLSPAQRQALQDLAAQVVAHFQLRRARRELEQRERWFRSLVENASDMIAVVDAQGRYLYVSPSVTAALGYLPAELEGRNAFDFILEDDVVQTHQALATALGDAQRAALELRFRSKAGEWRTISVILHTDKDPDGNPIVIINSRDVTAERQLRRQLEQSDRVAALGRVASALAHEFNNVLMGIQPFVELLERRVAEPHVQQYAAAIRKSVDRGKSVTGQVLQFTREIPLSPQAVDAASFASAAVAEIRRTVPGSISVEVSARPDAVMLADPARLQEVLRHLALNARDAMPNGGTIRIAIERATAEVAQGRVSAPERYTHIEVSDTGEGIAPDVLAHLFDPFFTTRKRTGGAGLGLTLAERIVAAHGGAIWADARPGPGSTFHLLIPSAPAADVSSAQRSESLDPTVQHVLVVDDDEAVNAGIRQLLASYAVATTAATTGAEAVAMAGEVRPDVLVLDYGLPDITGAIVLRKLREEGFSRPVVMITGHADPNALTREVGEELIVLQKPFDAQRLVAALNDAVRS